MQNKIKIENLQDSNIDDVIRVCSSKRLDDPVHQEGVRLKRLWLKEMLDHYGSCAKIAYHNDKPAAQILYYPETADKAKAFKRESVLVINCIYNPTPEARRLGLGKMLLQGVIKDVKERKSCLGDKPCRFILANAFNTGELLPMPDFYRKYGFIPTGEGSAMYFPMEGEYEPVPKAKYEPLEEDAGKAVIFYGQKCQFSYSFAKRVEAMIRETLPNIKIEMINEWEKPEESMKRGNWWLVVNAKAIHTFFMDADRFKAEIRQAAFGIF
ncbi:MAG: GNAT family N-acetyltransferase [Candidatus Bathyarchaeia archaeon]